MSPVQKECSGCGQWKSVDLFPKYGNRCDMRCSSAKTARLNKRRNQPAVFQRIMYAWKRPAC